jgi:hypothetical protein
MLELKLLLKAYSATGIAAAKALAVTNDRAPTAARTLDFIIFSSILAETALSNAKTIPKTKTAMVSKA